MIRGMFDSGALPALQRLMQFTEARQQLLSHNIANVSTPNFRPADVRPADFQAALGEAIDRRRDSGRAFHGPLEMRDQRGMEFDRGGTTLRPEPLGRGILFHDRNDRDLERLMQDLAENTMAHEGAVQMLNQQYRVMETAIRERL